MKIVIEGCDGVGKTTIANQLSKLYGLDICHCDGSDPKDFNFYSQTIRKENVIWDRHTIGELIYPAVHNRIPQMSLDDVDYVVKKARKEGVKFFIITAEIDTIKSRLKKRGKENSDVLESIPFINKMFVEIGKLFGIPIIDTTNKSTMEVIEEMEVYL